MCKFSCSWYLHIPHLFIDSLETMWPRRAKSHFLTIVGTAGARLVWGFAFPHWKKSINLLVVTQALNFFKISSGSVQLLDLYCWATNLSAALSCGKMTSLMKEARIQSHSEMQATATECQGVPLPSIYLLACLLSPLDVIQRIFFSLLCSRSLPISHQCVDTPLRIFSRDVVKITTASLPR